MFASCNASVAVHSVIVHGTANLSWKLLLNGFVSVHLNTVRTLSPSVSLTSTEVRPYCSMYIYCHCLTWAKITHVFRNLENKTGLMYNWQTALSVIYS